MSYFDFNSAEDSAQNQPLIPKGALAKVRLFIRPGGHNDPAKGWTGGYARRSADTGAVYLDCEYSVLDGPYARRKLWTLIGLHSEKGDAWMKMGRAFIKGILNSAHGLRAEDDSRAAQAKRRIESFADLDGLEFVAKIDVERDDRQGEKNVVKGAVGPEHKDYAALMHGGHGAAPVTGGGSGSPLPPPAAARASVPTRPAWAQ